MRFASVNVHKTSRPGVLVPWLSKFADEHDIYGLLCQEMTLAHGRELRRHGFNVAQFAHHLGLADFAIAAGSKMRNPVSRKMSNKRWFGWRTGKMHAPRHLVWADFDGVPVGTTHGPPGVDAYPKGLRGKADRVAAWIGFVRAVRRWARHRDQFVIAADWNDPAWRRGPFSINWLAKKTGAKIVSLGGIDYVLAKGVKVKPVGKFDGGPGMDHEIFVFDVTINEVAK